MLYIIKTFDNAIFVYTKKNVPPKPLTKALTLFNQLLGFFSSNIILKSYAVHSAIRTFISLLLYYKGTYFIEKKALNHCLMHNLSKFYLKTYLLESKSCNNWRFLCTFATHYGICHLCTTYWKRGVMPIVLNTRSLRNFTKKARVGVIAFTHSVGLLSTSTFKGFLRACVWGRGIISSTLLWYNKEERGWKGL